jgi:hypothetical protein
MATENKALVLEKILLMHYSIDVKLTEMFKCTTLSFSKGSTLFKGIFTPLQTHCANATKITVTFGAGSINLISAKESILIIAEKLQVHDVIEQRLKHIRQIITEIIKEIISIKKSGASHTNDCHIKLIADINAAQLACINNEYNGYCLKLDSALSTISDYLSDWEDLTSILKNSEHPETTFLVNRNLDLRDKILAAIRSFQSDTSYKDLFLNTTSELTKFLSTISSLIRATDKINSSNLMLTQLHNLYTTQREREIFNSIVHPGTKNKLGSHRHSDVDFF